MNHLFDTRRKNSLTTSVFVALIEYHRTKLHLLRKISCHNLLNTLMQLAERNNVMF